MENLGYLAALLAFVLSVYAVLAALGGKLRRNPFLELSAQRAVLAAWLMTTAASAILLHAILTDNFSFNYVASRSNASLDLLYKVAGLVGRTGRIAAVMELDRGNLFIRCRLHRP